MEYKRHDGRKNNELRPLSCEQGALFRADGSARMSYGNTTVLVAVHGPGQAKTRRHEQIDRMKLDVCFKLEKGQTSMYTILTVLLTHPIKLGVIEQLQKRRSMSRLYVKRLNP